MPIEYLEQVPDPDSYFPLFESTGWQEIYGVDRENLARSLRRSWYVVAAYEASRLVGLGRVISDGVLYAVVFDMIVAPSHQGLGIGRQIMERILKHCSDAGVRDILLFSARGKRGFYEKFGFLPRPDDAPGMILRRSRSHGRLGELAG
jgi:GNAT superfamily N-acetyltransferase